MRSVGPALLLLVAGVVVIVAATMIWGAMAVTSHSSEGCNYIPIVNGKPAYNCNSGMPHN